LDLDGFRAVLASGKPSSSKAAPAGAFTGAVRHANPYEQFEVTVLKSLFEMMLPEKADSVFGAGFAGEVWKSMVAQSLAEVAGKAGIAGIARGLARKQKAA